MCCLVDNASWNCQTNTLARSIYPRSALQSLDARRGHAKKVGNFLLLCLVQVSCNSVQQEIIQQWKKNSWAFVLVYELSCTELHGNGSFVKRIDPFCAINRHDCVLQLRCLSVCQHCKHLDPFEFLCVVQVKRNTALHHRKLKSRGINLIQLAPTIMDKSLGTVVQFERLLTHAKLYPRATNTVRPCPLPPDSVETVEAQFL